MEELKKLEEAAEAVVEKVEEKVEEVKKEVVKLVVEITAEEKLAVREIENTFLKAELERQRIQKIITDAQTNFPKLIEGLAKKYAVDINNYLFDAVTLTFKKKQ